MYVNRLRHDDYLELFRALRQNILHSDADVNPRTHELLQTNGLKLAERFAGKPKDVLEIAASWIVAEKNPAGNCITTSLRRGKQGRLLPLTFYFRC